MAEKFHDEAELKKLFELLAAHETRHGESFPSLENQLSDFN
jgi:rubrerythrin